MAMYTCVLITVNRENDHFVSCDQHIIIWLFFTVLINEPDVARIVRFFKLLYCAKSAYK